MICDDCVYYVYNEELDEYICEVCLDEDEYARFLSGNDKSCPYFRGGDDYSIVRKQN